MVKCQKLEKLNKKQVVPEAKRKQCGFNTEIISVPHETALQMNKYHSIFCKNVKFNQFCDLHGAKITIVRSKFPSSVNVTGIVTQELPDKLVLDHDGKQVVVQKRSCDWICNNVYFHGRCRKLLRKQKMASYDLQFKWHCFILSTKLNTHK